MQVARHIASDLPFLRPSTFERKFLQNIMVDQVDVFLAIHARSTGSLGAAYYCSRQCQLFVLQEALLTRDSHLESLVVHVQPTAILVSERMPDSTLQLLQTGFQFSHEGRLEVSRSF